jgi:ribulose-phosphate 3-epimerase
MAIKICASILSANFLKLGDELKRAEEAGCDYIHVDVVDGHLARTLAVGLCVAKWLPLGTTLRLDAHLAVSEPQYYIEAFADAGMNALLFHPETYPHHFKIIEEIKKRGMLAGAVLITSASVESIRHLLPDLDIIDQMAVNPGFPNQLYQTVINEKVADLKRRKLECGYSYEIQVDGGINEQTAGMAIEAGADVLISGSALFESRDMTAVVRNIRQSG